MTKAQHGLSRPLNAQWFDAAHQPCTTSAVDGVPMLLPSAVINQFLYCLGNTSARMRRTGPKAAGLLNDLLMITFIKLYSPLSALPTASTQTITASGRTSGRSTAPAPPPSSPASISTSPRLWRSTRSTTFR